MNKYHINYSYTNGNGQNFTASGFYIASELNAEDITKWAKRNIIGQSYNIAILHISEPK